MVDVELRHLDHRHKPIHISVQLWARGSKVKSFIRNRFDDGRHHSQESSEKVRLFSDGKEIHRRDPIERSSVIWYRIGPSCNDESLTITQFNDRMNAPLEGAFYDQLIDAIEDGETVAQVRCRVAERLGVEDHNRIILIARDGMRPGLVQCDGWEVRQLRKWQCRWLSLDVGRKNTYIVLEGLGRRYVYHPDAASMQRGMELKKLKRWMEQRLFAEVSRSGSSDVNLKWVQIALLHKDSRLGSFTPAVWGATYQFELPDDLADALNDEESWLLRATETCIVCSDDKKVTEMPVRTTSDCDHKPTVCKDCMAQWIHSSLESTAWDRLKCPECPQFLKFGDVRRLAAAADFSRYDTLATRAALKDIPNFRWCLSTKCESGQIHDRSCARFRCVACRSKHCVRHDVAWHSGETCEEYDKRNRRRMAEDKASEEEVRKSTRRCPECKRDVHKWTGCNHITCICGHEWCYICFAPFKRNHQGFLYCRHYPHCTETDALADIIDPPIRAGGRRNPAVGGLPVNAAGRFVFPPPLRPRQWQPGQARPGHPGGAPPPAGAGFRFPPPPPPPPIGPHMGGAVPPAPHAGGNNAAQAAPFDGPIPYR